MGGQVAADEAEGRVPNVKLDDKTALVAAYTKLPRRFPRLVHVLDLVPHDTARDVEQEQQTTRTPCACRPRT